MWQVWMWVKCLLYRHLYKRPGVVLCTCNPSAGGRDSWAQRGSLLASASERADSKEVNVPSQTRCGICYCLLKKIWKLVLSSRTKGLIYMHFFFLPEFYQRYPLIKCHSEKTFSKIRNENSVLSGYLKTTYLTGAKGHCFVIHKDVRNIRPQQIASIFFNNLKIII